MLHLFFTDVAEEADPEGVVGYQMVPKAFGSELGMARDQLVDMLIQLGDARGIEHMSRQGVVQVAY